MMLFIISKSVCLETHTIINCKLNDLRAEILANVF